MFMVQKSQCVVTANMLAIDQLFTCPAETEWHYYSGEVMFRATQQISSRGFSVGLVPACSEGNMWLMAT